MKLMITPNQRHCELGDYVLSPEQFNDRAYHPYLLSQQWDVAVVDICEEINTGYISQLINCDAKMVPVFRQNHALTPRELLLMLAMFPDHRMELISAYQNGADSLERTLREMNRRYMWEIK